MVKIYMGKMERQYLLVWNTNHRKSRVSGILASGHLKGSVIFSGICLSLTEEGNKRFVFIKRQLWILFKKLRFLRVTKSSQYIISGFSNHVQESPGYLYKCRFPGSTSGDSDPVSLGWGPGDV